MESEAGPMPISRHAGSTRRVRTDAPLPGVGNLLLDTLLAPVLGGHYLYHRLRTDKYGPDAGEKWGNVPPRSGDGPCLWIHAVSVGESIAAKPLIEGFATRHPEYDLRISTTTATGRAVAGKRYGAGRVFYYPLDLSWCVRRVLRRVRPSLLVLMELEVWPNLLSMAERAGLPVVVANCRITERSARGFRKGGALARGMLRRVALWLSQSEAYTARLVGLGVDPARVRTVGSLKYDAIPIEIDDRERARYRRLLGAGGAAAGDGASGASGHAGAETDRVRPILVAGSTHPSEETAVLASARHLWAHGYPDLRVALAPRHPERLDEVEAEARAVGAVVRRGALGEDRPADAPIVLVDTMGELGKLYAAADLVFVGGSLIDHGGQNMMEPCGLGRPTIMGPSDHNFAEPAAVLAEADGLCRIADATELPAACAALLADPEAAAAMGARARTALVRRRGATARSLEALDALLQGSICRGTRM